MPKILVVDDDDVIRDTLHELLSEDYACETADTAEQAMAQLQAAAYDVVLTDITMPGLSGVELLAYIRQNYSETLVILISGIGDQEHAQSLIKLGAFDFIVKPFSLEVVEKSVRRAVEFRGEGKSTPSRAEAG
jgi:DNA-binding NtrC family response regulator